MVGRHIYSYTYNVTCGLKIAHDTVVRYLAEKGFTIHPIYGWIPVSPNINEASMHFKGIKIDAPLLAVWYVGFSIGYVLAHLDADKIIYYGFVEGEPILLPEVEDKLKKKAEFIAPSNFVKDILEKRGFKVHGVFYTGVIPERLIPSPTQLRAMMALKRGRKMLCYIADNQPRKAIPQLIDAYLDVLKEGRRDTVLYILTSHRGGIPDDLPDNIIIDTSMFTVGDDYVASILHACDIYVHASMSEGLGLPILEAQTVGKPVIVTDAPPMNEICNERWCIKVPYRRIETYLAHGGEVKTFKYVWEKDDMAKAILDALNREYDSREIMERSSRWDYRCTLSGLERVIEEIIEK